MSLDRGLRRSTLSINQGIHTYLGTPDGSLKIPPHSFHIDLPSLEHGRILRSTMMRFICYVQRSAAQRSVCGCGSSYQKCATPTTTTTSQISAEMK